MVFFLPFWLQFKQINFDLLAALLVSIKRTQYLWNEPQWIKIKYSGRINYIHGSTFLFLTNYNKGYFLEYQRLTFTWSSQLNYVTIFKLEQKYHLAIVVLVSCTFHVTFFKPKKPTIKKKPRYPSVIEYSLSRSYENFLQDS